jgi:hypothetical protein
MKEENNEAIHVAVGGSVLVALVRSRTVQDQVSDQFVKRRCRFTSRKKDGGITHRILEKSLPPSANSGPSSRRLRHDGRLAGLASKTVQGIRKATVPDRGGE